MTASHASRVRACLSLRDGTVYAQEGRVTPLPALRLQRVQSTQVQGEEVAAGAAIGAMAGQLLGKNSKWAAAHDGRNQ